MSTITFKEQIAKEELERKTRNRIIRAEKNRPKGRWYNINHLFSYDWARYFFTVGAGDTGKSYAAMSWAINQKYKYPENVRFYWLRLTDTQADRLLRNNAAHFIDGGIYRKWGKEVRRKGNTVEYGYKVQKTTKAGNIKTEFIKEGNLCDCLSLSTFFNNKGEAFYDFEFKGTYIIILDEMNREANEANRFDIVNALANQLENLTRDTKCKVYFIGIGNSLEEVSDILSAFEFIPKSEGIFKLKRRKCVIEVLPTTEKYLEDRKDAMANILAPKAARFKSVQEINEEDVITAHQRRTLKASSILCFDKSESNWFVLNENNIISKYRGQSKTKYGMRRHLDALYIEEYVQSILTLYNLKDLKYDSYATSSKFRKAMELLKK